jgi:hypothetical protein
MLAVMAKRGPKAPMSDEHKEALRIGRSEGAAVRHYLEALRQNKPKRGRKRTQDSVRARLAAIESELTEASPLDELRLLQERRDLQAELVGMGTQIDLATIEQGFVEVAASYSKRQGISYATWRDVGVDAAVLKRAGIRRSD